MPMTRLTVEGYRGFKTAQTIDFAVPNGSAGSGLTFITGTNNSGKSTILECLRARGSHETPSFTSGVRNMPGEFVKITYSINDQEELLLSLTKGGSETRRENVQSEYSVFVLPSRRAFEPYFGRGIWNRQTYVLNTPLPAQRTSVLQHFAMRLFNVLAEPDAFNDIAERVLGFRPVWTIDRADTGQYFLKFFNGSNSHSSDGMGEGIVSIFAIVDSLYDSKAQQMVVIDEPELSLHPSLQKRLYTVLADFAQDRQIVIATHSPYFVDLGALKSGAKLVRVKTSAEDGTTIHQLTVATTGKIVRVGVGNINNPHVFGLNAKELFFQEDGVILVEGQEDVLLYPHIAGQLGLTVPGSFFGWGVGGAANMPIVAQALSDLGFKKVAGILDGDKRSDLHALRQQFPKYYFAAIAADDVRTKKPQKERPGVTGLLDEALNVREEHKEQTVQLFQELAEYVSASASR